MPQKRVPLFDTTEDQTLRIQKELAMKIGFNEAIVLMQIEYLISISTNNHINDNWWTFQTLEELKENSFPWWSIATISRILRNLKDQGIIFIDSFNKRSGDKTQWFALNVDKVRELGIKLNDKHPIFQNEKWVGVEQEESQGGIADTPQEVTEIPQIEPESQPEGVVPHFSNCKTIFQNDGTIFQIETTLPIDSSKTSNHLSPNGDSSGEPQQPILSPDDSGQPEEPRETLEPDTPETQLIFEKINHNRKLKGWGPVKRFKSYEQKQRCLEAVARLDHVMFTASLSKGLEKGLTDLTSLVNWIAAWKARERKKVKNGQKQPTTSERGPYTPEEWDQMLKST